MLRALQRRWNAYKYRFVPWVALNLRRKRRTLRYVPESSQDKIISDEDVFETLLKIFKALFINDFSRQAHILALLPEIKCKYLELLTVEQKQSKGCEGNSRAAGWGRDPVERAGTVYRKHEPIFFQSLGNPFIFRCIDGVLIDGNDKGISRSVYRSCSRRDQLGPFQMSDESWLTAALQNPLAVGQYVNNCSHDPPASLLVFRMKGIHPKMWDGGKGYLAKNRWAEAGHRVADQVPQYGSSMLHGKTIHKKAANVCYQEFDVPGYFPVELKQYLPNIVYSHDIESHLRCVVLVTLRDIKQGEELFSNYYTVVS
ncbi:SET domain-containing protein 9 isoform 3-T3 [Ciconia maguari]